LPIALSCRCTRPPANGPATIPDIFEGEFQHTGKTVLKRYKLANKRENQHLSFYTVLENDTPGWFQFDGNFYEGKCFIAGQRILHGEHFFLGKGRFPLLVPSVMADGEFSCHFQFVPSSEEKARAFYADPARAGAFAAAREKHAAQLAQWKAAGGANVQWLDHAERLRRWNYLNLRRGMGEGGFQGEGESYTLECHHVIHDYACAYQNVFGRSVTGLDDISHFAPRCLLTTVWSAPDRDGPDYKLTIEGNSFTLAHKDATMKATFVSPPNVQITHAKGRMKSHPLSKIDDAEVNAIHASGVNPAAGDFLVVLTLQTGAAPAVSVQAGAAKVGGRTVTFDGRKLTVD
jgi:hypothetical protein